MIPVRSAAVRSPLGSSRDAAQHWVREHGGGDLIACSALQPDMELFSTSFGVWPYRRVGGMEITLGGPLCDPADQPAMIDRFLAHAKRPILFYVREDLLRALDGTGLRCAGIGVDRHVDLPAFLRAPHPSVQGAVRKARRAGVTLRPVALDGLSRETRNVMETITARYLEKSEVTVEMSFINRPMRYEPDGLRRVFLLERNDREHQGPFGYAVLNPVFDRGQRTGYLLDILRFVPTRLWGVWLSSVHALAELLHSEGEDLSLGFCPLHGVRPAPLHGSRVLQGQVDWMVRYLSTSRYLTQLRELKDRIPGPAEPRYVASFTRAAPVVVYALMEAMGIGFGYLFGPDLITVLKAGAAQQLGGQR